MTNNMEANDAVIDLAKEIKRRDDFITILLDRLNISLVIMKDNGRLTNQELKRVLLVIDGKDVILSNCNLECDILVSPRAKNWSFPDCTIKGDLIQM